MREAVNNHALPIYKKNRIASLLCIFESTIISDACRHFNTDWQFEMRHDVWLVQISKKFDSLFSNRIVVCHAHG